MRRTHWSVAAARECRAASHGPRANWRGDKYGAGTPPRRLLRHRRVVRLGRVLRSGTHGWSAKQPPRSSGGAESQRICRRAGRVQLRDTTAESTWQVEARAWMRDAPMPHLGSTSSHTARSYRRPRVVDVGDARSQRPSAGAGTRGAESTGDGRYECHALRLTP